MAFRQRQVSSGYYDFLIKRWVQSLTLEQAANNLDVRHKIVTQENQHIEKKTLDDYWSFIKLALDPKNPFDFEAYQDKEYSYLRNHTKQQHLQEIE